MQTQLALTFRSQPDVINVELRANQDLVRVEDNGSVLPPVQDEGVPARQIAVSSNELVRYENNRISPLPDMQPVAALGPRSPAESPVSQTVAFLNESRTTLYSMVPGQPARALTTRSTLSRSHLQPPRLGLDRRARALPAARKSWPTGPWAWRKAQRCPP